MTVPLITFALSLIFCASGHQSTPGDGASGPSLFGWSWGTPRPAIEGRQSLEPLPSGETGVRRFRTGFARLGEAVLGGCEFEFVGDRFAGVAMTTSGRENSRALLQELRRLFGPGQEQDPRGIGWLNETTHAQYDEGSAGDAYVYIYARRFYPAPRPGTPVEPD